MSEKYRGIRVFWDGNHLMTTKDKKAIPLPLSIANLMPKVPFEADLWYLSETTLLIVDRSRHEPISKLLSALKAKKWDTIKLLLVDAPTRWYESYEERIKFLKEHIFLPTTISVTTIHISSLHPFISVIEKEFVHSKEHYMKRLHAIFAKQGEGIIFRKPGSKYLDQDSLFKVVVCTSALLFIFNRNTKKLMSR